MASLRLATFILLKEALEDYFMTSDLSEMKVILELTLAGYIYTRLIFLIPTGTSVCLYKYILHVLQ